MKTNLFYFSATGNSLAVAKDIAAKLPEARVFSIPQVMNGKIDLDADHIGLVFPVYFMGLPRMVIDFIDRLDPGPRYVFAVATSGAPFPGIALAQVQKQLETKGLKLNAGFSIQMPGSYLVKYGAFSSGRQDRIFAKEKKKIDVIVRNIKNQQNNKAGQGNFLINRLGDPIYRSMLAKFPTLDRNFHVNDKCNSCGICEQVCPVKNLKMADGKPTWQGNCQHCLACIQWCPAEAIQYGTRTGGRKRYHHPEIRVKELYRES